jgi:predicted ArsR family transcriptional regulator
VEPASTKSARDRVLFHLKTKGPQTAAELARRLDVTPMAVRQHLASLSAEGLVASADERRKVGRPARLWTLTPAAAGRFPDSHSELTVDLLKAVRTTFGEEGLERLVTERGRQQRSAYAARLPGGEASVEARVAALASLRHDEGYMAEWQRDGEGSWLLVEHHCPVCAAAVACQGLCRDELAMFRDLLGDAVSVTRSEHLLSGARRCAYRIEARRGANAPAPSAGDAPSGSDRPSEGDPP